MAERTRRRRPTMGPAAVLVANPTAQTGKAAEWIRSARALLDESGIGHRFVPTEPNGATVELVRKLIDGDGAREIIYMGGDGTFAEVAKGILSSGCADACVMGMLPTGTANDQGKSFGLSAGPGALERNVRVIAAGYSLGIDVGRLEIERSHKVIHRDLFFDSFSVGLSASSLETRNRDRDRVGRIPGLGAVYRNQLVYAGAILQRFVESYVYDIKFDADVIIDGRVLRYDDVLDLIIKNTKIFGGEWIFDPDAEVDDGRFELMPVKGRRDFTAKLLAGFRHNPVDLEALRAIGLGYDESVAGAQFEIAVRSAGGALPTAQIDGEELPAGDRYRCTVLARALKLIVPKDQVDPSNTDPDAG